MGSNPAACLQSSRCYASDSVVGFSFFFLFWTKVPFMNIPNFVERYYILDIHVFSLPF